MDTADAVINLCRLTPALLSGQNVVLGVETLKKQCAEDHVIAVIVPIAETAQAVVMTETPEIILHRTDILEQPVKGPEPVVV